MSSTERSFADRLQRGREILAVLTTLAPPFAPADPTLVHTSFEAFLNSLDQLNTEVANKEAEWREAVTTRSNLVADLKDRALRVKSRVKSNTAWADHLKAVETAVNDLRGYKITKPKPTVEDPKATTHPKTDQSFGDIKLLLSKLNAALSTTSGYNSGAPVDIKLDTLITLAAALDSLNQDVAYRDHLQSATRAHRAATYDNDSPQNPGLRQKMLAIKESLRSQYGSTSPAYLQAKGIKV